MLAVDHLDAVARSAAKATEWSERLDNDIEAAYRSGASLQQITDRCGTAVKTIEGVRQKLLRRGVELRPQGKR